MRHRSEKIGLPEKLRNASDRRLRCVGAKLVASAWIELFLVIFFIIFETRSDWKLSWMIQIDRSYEHVGVRDTFDGNRDEVKS